MKAQRRVLIVDDHAVVRQGLQALLTSRPEVRVVGEASLWVETARRLPFVRGVVVEKDSLSITLGDAGAETPLLVRALCPLHLALCQTVLENDCTSSNRNAVCRGCQANDLRESRCQTNQLTVQKSLC